MTLTLFFCSIASTTGKQTTLQFKAVDKKPKKNAWSDDESDSLSDGDMEAEEFVAPREKVQRKTKGEFTRITLPLSKYLFFPHKVHESRCNHSRDVWIF